MLGHRQQVNLSRTTLLDLNWHLNTHPGKTKPWGVWGRSLDHTQKQKAVTLVDYHHERYNDVSSSFSFSLLYYSASWIANS